MKWPGESHGQPAGLRSAISFCMRLGRGSPEQRRMVRLVLVFSLQPLRASCCSEAGPLEPVLAGVFPGPYGSTSLAVVLCGKDTWETQPRLTLSVLWGEPVESAELLCPHLPGTGTEGGPGSEPRWERPCSGGRVRVCSWATASVTQ